MGNAGAVFDRCVSSRVSGCAGLSDRVLDRFDVLVGPGEAQLALVMVSSLSADLWRLFYEAFALAWEGEGQEIHRLAQRYLEAVATPYEWAVAVAESLETGVLLTYSGTGHTSYGLDQCVDDVVDAYLIDLSVPPDDIECGWTH